MNRQSVSIYILFMEIEELRKVMAKGDGKTTLVDHTATVIKAGLALLQSLSLSENVRNLLKEKFLIAATLHDLGKVHPLFQKRLTGNKSVTIRHELVSLWFCTQFLNIDDDILFAIATHHKCIEGADVNKSFDLHDLVDAEFDRLYRYSLGTMDISTLKNWLDLFPLDVNFNLIGQQETVIHEKTFKTLRKKFQHEVLSLNERKWYSLLRALLQAADHIASAGIVSVPKYEDITLEKIQPRKNGVVFTLRHFQEVMLAWKGDVVLHAPTGSGKTEAALIWILANQTDNNRLIYLLPYTASINAMVNRLTAVYNKNTVTVLHSKSLNFIYDELVNEDSNTKKNYLELESTARNKNSLTREIYYPVKVTTLHQILRTPLYGKGWEFSTMDYQNALFIIDEFHAYNALLTGMMLGTVRLFRQIFHTKFMFMSATIPDFLLEMILTEVYESDRSVLLRPDSQFESDAVIIGRKRHRLVCHNGEGIMQAIPEIEKALESGLSVLVIVNNVRTCQQLFENIDFDKSKKKMLHGGFNLKSRKEIEKLITHEDRSKRPQLLVATQAVEVSLDIDYNRAFIENAPIDALIQRFGRVNRNGKNCDGHGNKIMAEIHLFENIEGRTPFYNNVLLQNTWYFLSQFDGMDLSENDLVDVCNDVYKEGYSGEQADDFNQGLLAVKNFERDWIAGACADWADILFDKNNQKIDVLCDNLYTDYCILIEEQRYIEANELLVSVYPYNKAKVVTLNKKGIKVLKAEDLYYDFEKGCIEKTADSYEII